MRISVTAPRGKMGALIIKAIQQREGMILASVIGSKDAQYIGQDAGLVCGLGVETGILVTDDWDTALTQTDVLIDFSTVEVAHIALKMTVNHKIPYICGTTGFKETDLDHFLEASQSIPVMRAANTSSVIKLMKKLLKEAAEALGDRADIDLIEMHDRAKKDAPSGTSKELSIAIKSGFKGSKVVDPNIHSIRSGDISSSHTVIFGLMGERLEITHHAHNWACFAEGALDAATFIVGKPSGQYTIEDI